MLNNEENWIWFCKDCVKNKEVEVEVLRGEGDLIRCKNCNSVVRGEYRELDIVDEMFAIINEQALLNRE